MNEFPHASPLTRWRVKHFFHRVTAWTTSATLVCQQRPDSSRSATWLFRATKTSTFQTVSRIVSRGTSISSKSDDAAGTFDVIAATHFRIGVAKIFVWKCGADSSAWRLEPVTQGSYRQSNRSTAV